MKREIRGAKKGQIRDMGIRDMGIRDKEGTEMGQRTVKGGTGEGQTLSLAHLL